MIQLKPGQKPFSIEAAKLGKAVCLRDGTLVKILATDRKGIQPVVALVPVDSREDVETFSTQGIFNKSREPSMKDLVMAPERIEFFFAYHMDSMKTSQLYLEEKDARRFISTQASTVGWQTRSFIDIIK